MEFETTKGKIEIKEAVVSNLKDLIPVYKEVFKVHGIFQDKNEGQVLEYLERNVDNIIVALVDGKVVGGVMVKMVNEHGDHGIWRLKHFAVGEGYRDLDIGTHLMEMVEKKIKDSDKKTNKIETRLSVNEEAAMPFYKKLDFKVEGEVISHYRSGEMVFFLGKEI